MTNGYTNEAFAISQTSPFDPKVPTRHHSAIIVNQQIADIVISRNRIVKYACKGKREILNRITTMVVHAPNNFPPEFKGMNMEVAWATIEHGLKLIEAKDGRPAIMEGLKRIRSELDIARELFEKNEIIPACHKLQDVEDILRPLKVKPEVQ